MDKTQAPLAVVVEHYLTSCRVEGKTPKTLRGYREKLMRFVRWLDGTLGDFTLEAVRAYISELQSAKKYEGHPLVPTYEQPLSPQTLSNHVRVLKGFSTWLFEEGYTSENVLGRLPVPKAPRKLFQILTEDEIGRLISSLDANTASGCRNLAMLMLLLDSGLRASELINARLSDLNLDDQWLKVMGKGQKERIVPFGARTTKMLSRYISFFRPSDSPYDNIFLGRSGEPITENTLALMFARLAKRARIPRLHIHLLRHTFATHYLIAGGDVFSLQKILGHSTLEMTRRYVELASTHVVVQHRKFSPLDRMSLPAVPGRNRRSRI